MKQLTSTLTLAGAAAMLAAAQLAYSPAHTAADAVFQPHPEATAGLDGLTCVSKKLILPDKPDLPGTPTEQLPDALARYGE